jgi:tyrosyl-tRNA synthetase
MANASPIDFLEELRWRGLLHQATHEHGLAEWLAEPAARPRTGYGGSDPTATSLTIGNMVAIMLLVHFQRAGHRPIVLMGGGTGLIGDPSGKSAERQLNTEETVRGNVEAQRGIFERIFTNAALVEGREPEVPPIVNNVDWLGKIHLIEFLRDVGKHFSVNVMIQRDSIRDRLHGREHGISYTEFSYMLLQAYDYFHLYQALSASVQFGGSDQWGNIVAGCDLIRRKTFEASGEWVGGPDDLEESAAQQHQRMQLKAAAFGVTAPLITKSDGTKFGKTESGAVWLSADRTSPYQFYQFWRNADDADVIRYLRIFTLLPREEIDRLAAAQDTNPAASEAKIALAHHVTQLVHGADEAAAAEAATRALFSGDIADLPERTLEEVLAAAPTTDHDRNQLGGEGLPLVDLLPQTTLAESKRAAREFLHAGSVALNGRKVGIDHRLTSADLLHGRLIALRRGKKAWHLTRWG